MDDELCECLEYDLKTQVQERITGLFTSPPRFTIRELVVWMNHFPADSALGRRGIGEHKPSLTDRLMAASINELRVGNHQYLKKNFNADDVKLDLVNLDSMD